MYHLGVEQIYNQPDKWGCGNVTDPCSLCHQLLSENMGCYWFLWSEQTFLLWVSCRKGSEVGSWASVSGASIHHVFFSCVFFFNYNLYANLACKKTILRLPEICTRKQVVYPHFCILVFSKLCQQYFIERYRNIGNYSSQLYFILLGLTLGHKITSIL